MSLLRVAVLIDLPREREAGGHVKYWERMADAAAREGVDIDLTVYFSGATADEVLSPRVRLRFLPPVFSTQRLWFLPYIPAHTDLALFHPRLARELADKDVLHATDGFFAFTRTAERVARRDGKPLVTSFHTDTPAYAEIFTYATMQNVFGDRLGGWLADALRIPARERASKETRLRRHLRSCDAVLAMRPEDIAFTTQATDSGKIFPMRLGVDKDLFTPARQDRAGVEREYGIDPGQLLVLFVGRVDEGKNMPVLLQACVNAIAKGAKLHLIVAGLGPLCGEIETRLGEHSTLAGFMEAGQIARLYASVDCLAIASDIEIGGMIGPEALASGCPVLVSRQSGVAQLCGDTEAMYMVESGVETWTQALLELARDRQRQAAMRAAALDFRGHRLASWGDVLREDFIPVWKKVADKKG